MFESIIGFFKKLVKSEQKETKSKETAKERLHLVLMQDRANVSADFLELMKQEIIEVIKKYIDVEEEAIDVRLTNEVKEDGTTGAPSLYANIPIINIKKKENVEIKENEPKEEKTKETEKEKTEQKDEKVEDDKSNNIKEEKKTVNKADIEVSLDKLDKKEQVKENKKTEIKNEEDLEKKEQTEENSKENTEIKEEDKIKK